jgi:hypothetical protein
MSEDTIARQEQNHKDGKAKKSKKRKRDPAGELEQTSGKDLKEESAAAKADRKKTKKQKRDLNTMDVQEAALALKESHPAKADKREEDRKSKKQRKAKRDVEKGLGRKRLAEEEGKEGVSAGTGTEAYVPPHATTDEVQDAVAEKSKTKKRKGAETNPSQETTGEVEQVRETQESIDHVQSAADDPEANGKDNKEKTIENVETGTASRFIVFIGIYTLPTWHETARSNIQSIRQPTLHSNNRKDCRTLQVNQANVHPAHDR